MATIVHYTDATPPENFYPRYIVSPPRSGPCCFSDMVEIGDTHQEDRWECVYKRCRRCGFTVQVIVRQRPDETQIVRLRADLARMFRREPR